MTSPSRSRTLRSLLAGVLAFAGLAVLPASAVALVGASRTWISGVGDDANPCSRTAPCKTLAGAFGVTGDGGEINALDPGGFGALTINRAITIDLSAAGTGGVVFAAASGILVNAGPTDDVVLRGLDIHGTDSGAAGCGFTGLNGVLLRNARSLRIEDSRIDGVQTAGIQLAPETVDAQVVVDGVDIRNSCGKGIVAAPINGHKLDLMVRNSTISNAGTGISAADGAHVWLTGTAVFGNARGLETLGSGVIDSFGDNQVAGNTTDGSPTRVVGGIPGPQGATGPQGPKGDPAYKLVVAFAAAHVKAPVRKRVSLGYVATTGAKVTLEIRKSGRRVGRVSRTARTGRNAIAWNGKIGGKAAPAGAYRLVLIARSADGQTATAQARLRLAAR